MASNPSNVIVLNTGNQAIITTDLSNIFLMDNKTSTGLFDYDNSGVASPVVIPSGSLLGRKSSGQHLVLLASGATDGSQYPVGILYQDVTVAASTAATSIPVTMCVAGEVAEEQIALSGSDTLSTTVGPSGYIRSLRDRIGSDTVGIILRTRQSQTIPDNQ